MKTIQVSDEDYEVLMGSSKELQMQPNHSQAFPYYWEASSGTRQINPHDEGKIVMLYDDDNSESYSPKEFAEYNPQLYEAFLRNNKTPCVLENNIQKYYPDMEVSWIDHVLDDRNIDVKRYSQDWVDEPDHNPSLFLSDVQGFIETNQHHLGRNSHTYAQTIWRMPKMIKLVEAIYRLNPQARETINSEAASIVHGK